MEEFQLNLNVAHEADCEKPGETFTAGQRNISRLYYKRVCDRESIIHSITYQSLNELLFYMEQIGFCIESMAAAIQKLLLFKPGVRQPQAGARMVS